MKKLISVAVASAILTACSSAPTASPRPIKAYKTNVGAIGTKTYLRDDLKTRMVAQHDWLSH